MRVKQFYVRLSKSHLEADESFFNSFVESVHVINIESALVHASTTYWSILVFYDHEKTTTKSSSSESETIVLDEEGEHVFQLLRNWRTTQIQQEGQPGYVIASNAALRHIAMHYRDISTRDDLAKIKHFGQKRADKYGDDIISVLHAFQRQSEHI